jgi:hypothetical protein
MSGDTRTNDDATSKRLNIVLPERTVDRINKVRALTAASSSTDVIRTAILTYEALAEYMAEGNRFYIKKDGQDQFIPVNFLFDVPFKRRGA